jgi:SAM-dependent methyltransferase
MNPHHLFKIQSWYEQATGLWVLEQERAILKQLWPQCYGHYLLQLGLSSKISELSSDTTLRNTLTLTPFVSSTSSIIGNFTQLPIASESIDVVLVHHWLGVCEDPLLALQEIYRVLTPEGRVIICGIRPSWLWQIYDEVQRNLQFPWSLRSASVWQVKNWLTEVGFTTASLSRHSQGLSLNRYSHHVPKTPKWCTKLPFGSGYIIVAQKHVPGLTPIKLEWAMRGELANYRTNYPDNNLGNRGNH